MHDHNHDEHHHHHAEVPAGGPAEGQAVCPVMGMPVNKQEAEDAGLKRTHNGQEYYLCCNTCAKHFDDSPEQYARNV